MSVCSLQSDGVLVGFISVTSDVDLKQLHNFDLSEFNGFPKQLKEEGPAAQSNSEKQEEEEEEEEERKSQTSDSQQQVTALTHIIDK